MDAQLTQELKEIAELLKLFPESLQQQVYDLVLSSRGTQQQAPVKKDGNASVGAGKAAGSSRAGRGPKPPKGARRRGTSATSHTMIADLDFRGDGSRPSFVDFIQEKSPGADAEFNTVAVYYLSRHLAVSDISQDHIYTCYKMAKRRVPTNMPQSLRNTHDRTGAIEYDRGPKNITLTTTGENVVEHELPKAGKVQ